MSEEKMYVVTCNDIRYTMPMSYNDAEAYMQLRQTDTTGRGKELSYGGRQRWAIRPATYLEEQR